MLDGEGGFAVWAKAIPAAHSLELGALPMGLAHNVRLKRSIKRDQVVSYADVDLVNDRDVAAVRREMEDRFKPFKSVAAQ
jgi:predicted homoserine dehydrogenase-like protein